MKRIFSFLVMTIALSTLLISCGGGGGGGTSGGTSGGGGGTAPSAFDLLSPANGETGVSLTPTFQWTDSTGEISYKLQIDTDDQFQDPIEIGPIPADTTSSPLPSGMTLPPGTTYYWRVIAVNDAGQTIATNAPFSFTTIGWAKTYGGTYDDAAYSIQQTRDGGYIVAGGTSSFGEGETDCWIMKLKSDGQVEWQYTYGGASYDEAYSIQQTSDGGYIAAGVTVPSGSSYIALWVLKLNSNGTIAWQKTYGGTIGYANSIQQTSDGGYIVAGVAVPSGSDRTDFWVLKLNNNGTIAWQKTYGGTNYDEAYSIQQTSDGGYIVAGATLSFGAGGSDFWVLKLNSNGDPVWQKTYGGDGYDAAYSIQETSDGGYIVAGSTYSFGAGDGSDFWVLKLNSSDGSIDWQKTYGGTDFNDYASSIQETSDGGYIVAGTTSSFGAGGGTDLWVLKLNSNGDPVWQKTYGGKDYDDVALSIQQTSDGGYIVAGMTESFGAGESDFWVLKLDSDGSINFNQESGASSTGTSAEINNTVVTPTDTTVTPNTTSAMVSDTDVTVKETDATIYQQAP